MADHPSLAIDMQLTDDILKVEEMQHIRLMVVGMFGVGKTTLVRRLCRKPTDDVKSTVGIDIFLDLCEVKDDLDWDKSDPRKKERYLKSTTTARMAINENTEFELSKKKRNHPREDFGDKVTRKKQKTEHKIIEEIAKKEDEPLKRRHTVSIWDFAGHSVYYSTHHFFLNARSVYILVLDLSKGLHDKVEEDNLGSITEGYTCLETFKFWMKSIYMYTKQKKASLPDNQNNEYTPKIILVGTFKDKISDEMLKGRTTEKYKDDYFSEALCSFEETQFSDLVHGKYFLISNKDLDEKDFLSIKKEIYDISKGMPFWNEQVPAKFIPLERALFQRKQKKKNTMKFSELKEVGHNVEYPKTDETDIKLFLSSQHAFGNVLYYNMGTHTDQDDKSDPSEVIILTPQWIINVFTAFVTHKDKAKEMDRLKSWEKFKKDGQLPNDLIDALLQQSHFLEDKEHILMYMENLKVIAKPVVFRAGQDKDSCIQYASSEAKHHFLDCTMKRQTREEDFYIMPCMLPPRPEMATLKKLYEKPDKGTHHTTLCMYIRKGFIPAFVLHRILATALKEMPIALSYGRKLLFSGLGSFKVTEKWMLTIWSVDNIIYLRVTFEGACKDEKDEIAFCKDLRERFEKLVLEVFNFYGKFTYDETNKAELLNLHIKCPGCDEQVPFEEKRDPITEKPVDYMIGLHSVKNLSIVKEKTCGCCKKVITADHALKYWFAIDQQPVDTRQFTQQQNEILRLDQLVDLAKEITLKVLPILRLELEISDKRYEQIKQDNPEPCRWVYSILYAWKKRGDCCKTLYDAMKRAGFKTEHFFRIIQGKDSKENKKTINKYMEQIKKGKDDILELTDCQIVSLSTCFGNDYWFFGIRLGITEREMQQIEHSNCKVKAILTVWNNRNEPVRKFIRAVVLSCCNWDSIHKVITAEHALKQNEILKTDVSCCHLVDLANEITSKVPRLLRALKISAKEYKKIKLDNPEPCRWVYCILYNWKKKGEGWEMLYRAMKRAGLKTERFFRIIQGKESRKKKKTINRYMKQIHKGKHETLELNELQIVQLSECFGADYWFFGLRIGIEHALMERIAYDNRYENIQKQVVDILNNWNRLNKRKEKTFRKFIRSVVLSGCNWGPIRKILIEAS